MISVEFRNITLGEDSVIEMEIASVRKYVPAVGDITLLTIKAEVFVIVAVAVKKLDVFPGTAANIKNPIANYWFNKIPYPFGF